MRPSLLWLLMVAATAGEAPVVGGRLWSTAGETAPAIAAIEGEDLVVESPAGPVLVPAVYADDAAMAGDFSRLVARADAAGVRSGDGASRLRFARAALTGLRLKIGDVLVVDGAVLRPEAVAASAAGERAAALASAARALAAAVPRSRVRATAATVLAPLMRIIADAKADPADEVSTPDLARRVLRDAVLAGALGDVPESHAYGAALAEAERLVPLRAWTGDGQRLVEYGDAVGGGGWVFARQDGLRLMVHPRSVSGREELDRQLARLDLVIDLPVDADAFAPELDRARLNLRTRDARSVATWDGERGLVVDQALWDATFALTDEQRENLVSTYWPPHIAVHGLDGRLLRLVTAHGALDAPRGTREDTARFIADAARVLPTAGHLDLLRAYVFAYAYDSPDPQQPMLLGTAALKGDIHQTAAQTLATTVGGVCRGDCDDLAELMQEILVRQGRLAHVIQLPGHLAAAWVEREGESLAVWRATTLHTGPPWTFTADSCPAALEKVYRHFAPSRPFDADRVAITLRFAGENQRSDWVLGERIFRDEAYAATMIDVERDWYFRTYGRAVAKMQALVAAGDHDQANYGELEGLYRRTGQVREAAAIAGRPRADDAGDDAATRRRRGQRALADAYERQDLHLALGRLRSSSRDLTEVPEEGDEREARARERLIEAIQLCGQLEEHSRDFDLALLRDEIVPYLESRMGWVGDWMDEHPGERLPLDGWTLDFVRTGGWAVRTIEHVLYPMRRRGLTIPAELDGMHRRWQDAIAFNAVDEDADLLDVYGSEGNHLCGAIGHEATVALIASAVPPSAADVEHRRRVDGPAQRERDLPWIAISAEFWQDALHQDLWLRGEIRVPNRAAIAAHTRRIEAAVAHAARLGLASPRGEDLAAYARLVRALAEENEADLDAVLDEARARDDVRRWESVAQTIGRFGGNLPTPWFKRALARWRQHGDAKPYWFEIAWSAANSGTIANARIAAAAAAARYPDEPAFIEEWHWLDRVLDARDDDQTSP